MTNKTEIESLLYLMDDPDPEVQIGVHNRFRELGENAVPLLDQFKSTAVDDQEKSRINDVIHTITFNGLRDDFAELLEKGVNNRRDLEHAVLALSRFGNPTLRVEEYRRRLDRFAEQVYAEIAFLPSDNEKMRMLLRFVFTELRFRGDSRNYHHTDNAYLDRVIDRRKGLPISLSLIVIFLARRLELPFFGVNMPIHFMLIFEGETGDTYIDPFDGGTIVSMDQCYYFLKKNGIEPKTEHLQKTPEDEILVRCIRNLIHSHAKAQDHRKVKDLQELLAIAELKG